MSLEEALIVTALGMTVVFIGLVLCIAFIQLFNRIAKRVSWGEGHGGHDVVAPSLPAPAPELPPGEPIEPDLLAVISAVLEVERTLYLGRPGSRLTIRRTLPHS